MHSPRKRRGGPSRKVTAALVFAACLGQGAGSSPGYPGASTGGANPMPQRQGQPPSGGYPPQQQQQQQQEQYQQQQYRSAAGPGGQGQGQAPPSSPPSQAPPSGPGGAGALYGRGGPPPGQQQQQQYRGGPPSQNQQYGQAQGQGGAGGGGGGYGGGGYPGGQQQQQQGGYGGRYPPGGMPPPQQQQQQPGGDGGGLLSRITNKLKGTDGPPMGGTQPGQGYGGSRYGGGGGGGSQQYPSQGGAPQGWQPPSRPGMALQATGPSRGPIQRDMGYQGQDGGYGGHQQAHQQHQQPGGGGGGGGGVGGSADGPGIWSRFKGKVFQGDANGEAEDGPPSFRPGGSVLKKKEESVASANIQAFGGPGAYGNPFPSFAGPPGLGGGQQDGPTPDLAGPGAPEVISVDGSIVMVLKPNDLAKKKRKFKQDGANRLQVIATFDHCLTAFHAKDGKTPCLKTTDALEQNQHVMLPEAAKKVRFLRSDFKRRMDEGGKTMTPDERVAALEDNLRKVYSVVAMEGGVHMNSIGPAIESQLDGIPLREGVDDMTAALAWRAIPLTIFCAGYGNVAMEVLRRGSPKITGPGGVFTPHLRLVANFFRPDDTMTIIGMYDTVPLIHEAKKSGATLLEFLRGVRQENAFSARSNVLLLGAELSDIGLGNGLPGVEERITVGFLKLDGHVLDKLPRYAQAYDVVILGDGDMSYANEILHEVVG